MGPVGERVIGVRKASRAIAAVAGATLLIALVSSGRITTAELIAYAVLVPSLLIHELAHLGAAAMLGDRSAQQRGRRAWSWRAHVDPLGTLVVPAILILAGIGFFGWARPAAVDAGQFRHPRNGRMLVALAGPTVGIALTVLAAIGFSLTDSASAAGAVPLPAETFYFLGLVNLWVALISLLPVPPLDGSVVLERVLPSSAWPRYLRIRPYLLPGAIGIVVADLMLRLGLLSFLAAQLDSCWSRLLGA